MNQSIIAKSLVTIATICLQMQFADASDRPNVIIVMTDDFGLHDIGIEGSSFYRTPNIDQLAKSSMRFTAGYANCRMCSPSWASIQWGTFPARHGVTQWIGGKSGMDFDRGEAL